MKHNAIQRLLSLVLAMTMVLGLGVTGVSAKETTSSKLSYEVLDPDSVTAQLVNTEEIEETDASAYADDETVRVTIVMEGQPVAVFAGEADWADASQQLKQQQDEVAAEISTQVLGGEELDTVWNLTLAMNAISANVEYGQIEAIEQVEGVAAVILETKYMPLGDAETTNIVSQTMTGANTVQASGYTGAGTRIAVVDTGVDTDHQSFAESSFQYALSQLDGEYDLLDVEEIASVLEQLHAYEYMEGNLTAEDLYINSKIPFGFNYIDYKTNVTHDEDTQGSHGSHVAGIAAANRYIASQQIFFGDGIYDFDGDGDQDLKDIQALMDYVVNGTEISNLENADISGDGYVTDYDVHLFLDMLEHSFQPAAETVGVTGVAPDAQIIAMKVFGAAGGAYQSDYTAAIEDAVLLGCDSINLSLGASYPGFSHSYTYLWYDQVMENLANTGVVVCISAGNSYNWADFDDAYQMMYADEAGTTTTTDPSTYTNAMSVASADNVGYVADVKNVVEDVELIFSAESIYYGLNEPWKVLDPDGNGTTYEAVFLGDPTELLNGGTQTDESIYGSAENFENYDYTNKIVFVSRGNGVYFTDMHMNAAKAGAAAVVIYNNEPGSLYLSFADSTATIPCGILTMDEAKNVFSKFTKNDSGVYTGSFTVTAGLNVDWGEDATTITMSDYSSWGTIGDLSIKPEITAPGGGIYSVNGVDKTGTAYEIMSGTSMASPHAAGISALASQYVKENGLEEATGLTSRQLVQSLMMSTAEPLIEEETGLEYSVRNQGAGLVNIQNIVSAQSHILVDGYEDGKVKAELGEGTNARTFTFTIYNDSDSTVIYDLSSSILTPGTVEIDGHALSTDGMSKLDASVTYSTSSTVIVPANGSKDVTVRIAIPHETVKAMLESGHDNGFYIEGYIYIQGRATAEGVQDVKHSIPLLGWYGSWTDPSMYDTGSYIEMYYDAQERPSHIQKIYNSSTGLAEATTMKNMLAWTYSAYNYPAAYSGNVYNGGKTASGEYGGDSSYIEARNAINVTSDRYWEIYGFFPTLIRNTVDADLFITDEEGNVLYRNDCEGYAMYANFYYTGIGAWLDYTTESGILIDDWAWAENLEDGTKLDITLGMVPESFVPDDVYYDHFEYDASYEADLFSGYEINDEWWVDGTVGDGAFLQYRFTVDNTAPVLDGDNALKLEDNTLTFTAKDNQYIAAVILLDSNGRSAVEYYYPDMAEDQKGKAITGSFDLSTYTGPRAVLAVCDYAGNETYYSVNLNGEQGTSYGDLVGFQYGDSWYRDEAAWVTFNTNVNQDETILYNDVVQMVSAEYINGYIFAQDSSGKLYGIDYQKFLSGAIGDLETTYITTLDNVYQDLAYSYKEGKLYGLVTTEYEGYPTSEVISINLNGSYFDEDLWRQVEAYEETSAVTRGGVYGLALAIDDEGTVYVLGPNYDWDTEELTETAYLWSVGLEYNQWSYQWQLGWSMTQIGDTGRPMNYLQSMTWNHNDEKLYWAQFSGPKADMTLQEVNPETAECTKVGTLSTETCAMFAPLTAETAAKEEHTNVPTFDVSEIGQPILGINSLTLGKNTTQTLTVTFEPWYTGHKNVIWSSSDESVATVDQKGKVTAVGEGTCTITVANAEDETKLDTCKITVASLSVNIEGIVSYSDSNISSAGNSQHYEFTLDAGTASMSYGDMVDVTKISEEEGMSMPNNISAAVMGRNGHIWAAEWGNSGLFYEIDPETMEVLNWVQPVGGDFTYGMTYSETTDKFTTIANYDLFVDLSLDDTMVDEMLEMVENGEDFMDYHKINMIPYLEASDEGFGTGENGNGSLVDVVLCGITTIDESYTLESTTKDYLGGDDYTGIHYTSAVTHVLLDNVGRFWYIDEIPNMKVYADDYGNVVYFTGEDYESAMYDETASFAMGGEYGSNGFFALEETDEDGSVTATGFYIRELQETPLTEMYRNGTMPRYSYNFSDLYYAGKTDDGAPLFFLSLYDFWNTGKTNQFYLYVGGVGTGEYEWDSSTWSYTEIKTPDELYELGNSGEYYVIATITSAEYVSGLPETEQGETEETATAAKSYIAHYTAE